MNSAALERLHPHLASNLAQCGIHETLTPPTAEEWQTFLTHLNDVFCQLEALGALAPVGLASHKGKGKIVPYLRGETDDAEAQAGFHLLADQDLPPSAMLTTPNEGRALEPSGVMTIPVRFA